MPGSCAAGRDVTDSWLAGLVRTGNADGSKDRGRYLKWLTRVILEVRAKPGTGDELIAFFRSILPETRAYRGLYKRRRRCATATTPTMWSWWKSGKPASNTRKYLAWQRERGTSDRLMEALAEPPIIRHFDVTDA